MLKRTRTRWKAFRDREFEVKFVTFEGEFSKILQKFGKFRKKSENFAKIRKFRSSSSATSRSYFRGCFRKFREKNRKFRKKSENLVKNWKISQKIQKFRKNPKNFALHSRQFLEKLNSENFFGKFSSRKRDVDMTAVKPSVWVHQLTLPSDDVNSYQSQSHQPQRQARHDKGDLVRATRRLQATCVC